MSRPERGFQNETGIPVQSFFVGSHGLKERKVQYTTRDQLNVIAIGLYAVISIRIRRPSLLQQLSDVLRIHGKRPGRISDKPPVDAFEGTVEPDGDSVVLHEFAIPGLQECSAAQGDHVRVTRLNLAHFLSDSLRLKCPKRSFAVLNENFRDGPLLLGFDFSVEIRESPSECRSKGASNGALTGCHKAHEKEPGGPLKREIHSYDPSCSSVFPDNEDMDPQLLPIFPLSLVLLPGMPLPLHIFEDRYKEMMADVLPAGREFGIVFAKDEGIVNIGCTATVQKVVRRYEDGRLDLLATGQRRFQIDSLNEDKSYLRAEVEYFDDDEEEEVPRDLKEKALLAFGQLKGDEEPSTFQAAARNPRLSFQIARLVKDLDERQTVLTLRSENERLEHLVRVVPGYLAQQEKIALAKRVGPLNGHAKHVVTS